jgi:hypothetical protein
MYNKAILYVFSFEYVLSCHMVLLPRLIMYLPASHDIHEQIIVILLLMYKAVQKMLTFQLK